MKNSQKGFAPIILVILIAAAAISGGVYYSQKIKVAKDTNGQNATTTEKMAGWQVYTNNQLGISFKYPQDWRISFRGVDTVIIEDTKHPSKPESDAPYNGIRIALAPRDKENFDWKTGNGYDIPTKSVYYPENGALVVMTALREEDKAIENEILSTLIFTSNSSQAAVNWKTYTNTKFGFQVNYPSGYLKKEQAIIDSINNIPLLAWFVEDKDKSGVYKFACDANRVTIDVTPQESRTYIYADSNLKENVIIDSQQTVAYKTISSRKPSLECDEKIQLSSKTTWIKKNGMFYIITAHQDDANLDKVFSQVISSFKFTSATANKPFNWEGTYSFGEVAAGGPGSVQSWDYKLTISSNGGRWRLGLNVDGFQALLRVNATANNVGNSLDVIFDSYGPESMQVGYKKYDTLFTLTPTASGDLAITWKKMLPNLDPSISGAVFKKVSNSPY